MLQLPDGTYTTYFCQSMCIYIMATGKDIKMYEY